MLTSETSKLPIRKPTETCNARNQVGYCSLEAGWQTSHAGQGRCRLHGGASEGRPITSGLHSHKTQKTLREKAEAFEAMPDGLHLFGELGMMRALLSHWLDNHDEAEKIDSKELESALSILNQTGKLVERIERVRQSTAFTRAEVQVFNARVAQTIINYITDPADRLRFVNEMRGASGTERLKELPEGAPTVHTVTIEQAGVATYSGALRTTA